jgi:hypothetical protein
MMRFRGKWCRTGVIYHFRDSEVKEVGEEIVHTPE